jgi:hypothetical protein
MTSFCYVMLATIAVLMSLAHGFSLKGATSPLNARKMSLNMADKKRVLVIGGTRFSGLYLWRELHKRVSLQANSQDC